MVASISPATRRASHVAPASPPPGSPSRPPPATHHPSRTHFIYKAKSGTHILQKLAGPSNYARWADNLRVILHANGLWDAVQRGLNPIAESPTERDAQATAREDALQSKRAFMVIFLSCTWPMQQKLSRSFDGASAWSILRDYAEYSRRDPHVALNLGRHRVEYSYGGCHWELWRLAGKDNWDEWVLGLRTVLEAEGLWRREAGAAPGSAEQRRRREVAMALIRVCVEPKLALLLQMKEISDDEEALVVLERMCGREAGANRESVVFAGADAIH